MAQNLPIWKFREGEGANSDVILITLSRLKFTRSAANSSRVALECDGLTALCSRRGFSKAGVAYLCTRISSCCRGRVSALKRAPRLWELAPPLTLTADSHSSASGKLASQSKILNPATRDLSIA
ncbi:hypothetical protein TNCV_2539671 [Trichonephila clavipes]|nr:hypothetical protein TNCV_2539671 [Trichonephila clavipes]